jgi:vancomycin resistance protein YoaR
MSTYTTLQRKNSPASLSPILLQTALALLGGLVLFFILTLGSLAIFDIRNAGKVYPGVSMSGIELSGLNQKEAVDKLVRNLLFPQTGKIVFEDGESIWVASPSELGLSTDYEANARIAYLHGRSGNPLERVSDQIEAWNKGVDIAPKMVYNEQAALDYLQQIANQVDRPKLEASLKLEGVEVIAVSGQVGRSLVVSASLEALRTQIQRLSDGVIPLVIEEAPPEIMDASQQADAARKILSEPLTLRMPDAKEGDGGPWKIPASQLAEMLQIERVGTGQAASIAVGLSEVALDTYLSALSGDINQYPDNARFIFNDDTRKLEVITPAVIGRSLDVEATIKTINESLAAGSHVVPLTLVYTQPEVGDDATGEQLGITENLVATTSYFRGSTNERLQNIQIAAANFHGLLIPPGATFSMASVMGNVSLDTGYAEAWIIFGGRTIKGVGGGVCQVSTTLFRAAFLAGLPIAERHPHAYRVGYYEQTSSGYDSDLAGLDATVFIPMVDFKFVNDTPGWLLMETYYYPNSRSLTWKFYGAPDGRRVEWESSGPQNVVEPPDPVYEENPDLAKGEVKQVDWEAEGADVTIIRTVYRDGQVVLSDSFVTHYLPWADVFQYGPGTNLKKLIQKNAPPIITR